MINLQGAAAFVAIAASTSLAFVPSRLLTAPPAALAPQLSNRQFGSLLRESADGTIDNNDESVSEESLDEKETTTRKKYVVIGGGWGGWGAAKALCESGLNADVTLIDALPDPTGVSFLP